VALRRQRDFLLVAHKQLTIPLAAQATPLAQLQK
jgi:hypothetical protein